MAEQTEQVRGAQKAREERGEAAPRGLHLWWLAARPKTLTAALAPILVGSALALAEGRPQILAALSALLGALFIQIGTNFANDLFDFRRGADDAERLGPTRVTSAGLVTPAQIAWATAGAFGLAFLCGLYLVALAGWPLLALGLVSIASGLAYTAGPWPLAYNGLGDVFVFVFFGLVATAGTHYVQAMEISAAALVYGASVGAAATGILIVNNLRDVITDRRHNKRTTAVLLGERAVRAFYGVMLVVVYAAPLGAWLAGLGPGTAMLCLGTLPLALGLGRDIYRLEGAALNPLLGRTAKLQLLTGVLLAIGIALGPWLEGR